MYNELVKRLRELQTITEHCGEQSCDECENRELCDKHDNKTLSGTYNETADAIETLSKLALDEHNRAAIAAWNHRWIPVGERLPEEWRPVRRGKWIGTHDGFYYTYSCSMCGYEALYKENTKDQVCSEFCPNCGADMREES